MAGLAMRAFANVLFVSLAASCSDDAARTSASDSNSDTGAAETSNETGGPGASSGATASTGPDTGSGADSEVGSTAGVSEADAESTFSGDTDASTSTSTTGENSDPFMMCASAGSAEECAAIIFPDGPETQQPSCHWRDVHTVGATVSCELISTEQRCIFFDGFLLGCGGGGSCGEPNEGEPFSREVGGAMELLFYPIEEVCGPVPTAPPDEAQWERCGRPPHPVCTCICDLI